MLKKNLPVEWQSIQFILHREGNEQKRELNDEEKFKEIKNDRFWGDEGIGIDAQFRDVKD